MTLRGGLAVGLLVLLARADAAPPAPPRVAVRSQTHPSRQNDFTFDTQPLSARAVGDEPPTVRLERGKDDRFGPVLRIVNQVSGGSFGVNLLDPEASEPVYTRLAFWYRADPRLKVNLFARLRHQDYEIGFTGPAADSGRSQWLGRLPEVKADDQWHALEVPLLRWLRQQSAVANLRLSELVLENRCQGDYLMAGFGGNGTGTTLSLARFEVSRPGPSDAKLTLETPGTDRVDGFAVLVDQRADSSPSGAVTETSRQLTLKGLSDGVHYVHVRARAGEQWGPVTHYRLEVDTTPPRVNAVRPAEGAEACPAIWRCRLDDTGSGVAPRSIVLTVNGRSISLDDPAVEYEPLSGELALHLAALGQKLTDGQPVKLTVTAEDEVGNKLPQPVVATFRKRDALDKEAPEQPRLWLRWAGRDRAEPVPGEGGFEYGLDEWQPFGAGGTVVERTDRTAASGRWSLRVLCTENASPFSCFVRRTPFDAARFRLLRFAYKVPPRLRVDFVLRCDGHYYRIRFTDRDDDDTVIGAVPNVIADNEWHRAEVDLYGMLSKRLPQSADLTVGLMLLTGGPGFEAPRRFAGNYAGTEYFIDDFEFVPLVGADARVEWTGQDLVGVSGARVMVGDNPLKFTADEAGAKLVTGDGIGTDRLAQGANYLQVRLADPAGNLSRPVRTCLIVNSLRPSVGVVWPADGSRAAPATIGVEVKAAPSSTLDLRSVRLTVAGREYGFDSRAMSYDPVTGRLSWDGRRAEPPVQFADGQSVPVALTELRDLAGNRPEKLPAWRFTMAWSEDHRGPEVSVSSRTHAAFAHAHFDGAYDPWVPDPAASAEVTVGDDGRRGRALWLKPTKAGAPWSVWQTFGRQFAASRFGWVACDYQIPAGMPLDLLVRVRDANGLVQQRSVRLTSARPGAGEIGAVDGIIADGQWHQAVFSLIDLLKAEKVFRPPFVVEAIGFGRLAADARADDRFGLFSLTLFRESTSRLAQIEWQAFDETGVKGYSYEVDQSPATEPAAQVKTQTGELTLRDVPRGLAWVHVRAVDGAGNWGPTTHFILKTP